MKKEISLKNRIIGYIILIISCAIFLTISYTLFAITPKEYYWLIAIVVLVIMWAGIIIISKIPFPKKM